MWKCLLLSALCGVASTWPAHAGETGHEIASRAQQVLFGYTTLAASAEMTLYEGEDEVGTRSLKVRLQEDGDPARHDLGLIHVTAPAVFRDTKLLSWSSGEGDDQQWLVLPRTDRARRIADRGRKATFVNSDFSFEDLLKWQLESYTYTFVAEADCPAGICRLVRAVPDGRASSYSRLDVYYDDAYRISRIAYFRPSSEAVWKEQLVREYVEVAGTWQPSASEMRNHESGTRTVIRWSDYVPDGEFNPGTFEPGGR